MMVLFVSQCEKKALKKTRRVLDAFADRIGDNTWQTVITEEGLQAVKKLLRKTASKNTAVSCHWIRSRARSDLLWVVGNKSKFDYRGVVAVNYTERDMNQFADSNQWKTLPIIKYAAEIAGLFHDFGKVTVLFQDKLEPNKKTEKFEPYRHEWVSMRLFQAFVADKTDHQWLTDLANGDINIVNIIQDGLANDFNQHNNPLRKNKNSKDVLPPFARLIAWLVLSHHKLPKYPESWQGDFTNPPSFNDIESWIDAFNPTWNSPKSNDPEQKGRIVQNWQIHDSGLPSNSFQWKSKACLIASKAKHELLEKLSDDRDWLNDELFTSHISRMALMLADHHFSSLEYEETIGFGWRSESYPVYANTRKLDNGKKSYKQQLDEHLIGVATHAKRIVSSLPKFINESEGLSKNSILQDSVLKTLKKFHDDKEKIKKLHQKFAWQDDAKATVKKIGANTKEQGFFGINMASTGCGKTIANAKIMYALGNETGKVRFNVALGLRTLTLQTGREFQDALNLSDDELSVAIGGIAVKALFENQQRKQEKKTEDKARNKKEQDEENPTGSESENDYLNPDLQVHFTGDIKDHALSEWTRAKGKRNKGKEHIEKLIQPAVLVCTIDHLIPATEGIKGGQQIAPMLRLLSSDLILDEPDDFGLADLPALCRLVHWSGMLGSRVLLSTATMPPAFVYACFEAYQAGWAEYAKANLDSWDGKVQCAWFDEREKSKEGLFNTFDEFKKQHNQFVIDRVKFLEKQPPKRIGKIVDVVEHSQKTVYENMAETIYQSVNELHLSHHVSINNKHVSIGLVRMANIDPMIAVVKALMVKDAPENTCIHYCVYHSRFPLAVRSHIEEKLDFILKRKDPDRIWGEEKGLGSIIDDDNQNHIFVVLASPVAEVGRDHDYDWAVVEPSSMRSIIQLAGRILRHRDDPKNLPKTANIHLLNKNIKGLKGKQVCFEKPGFESKKYDFVLQKSDVDMHSWLDESEYEHISSIAKVKLPKRYRIKCNKYINLSELEHRAITKQLFGAYKDSDRKNNEVLRGDGSAKVWWKEDSSWCAEIQRRQRFRKPKHKEVTLCRYLESELHEIKWQEQSIYRNEVTYENISSVSFDAVEEVVLANNIQFWITLDEESIFKELMTSFNQDMDTISKRFGNVVVHIYKSDREETYCYHKQFGIFQEVKNGE